jgi:nucleoside-diphosphate-sugar epimerase
VIAAPVAPDIRAAYAGKGVLVTGGAGFIGSSLVALLSTAECRIVRLQRSRAAPANAGIARVLDVAADVRDPAAWKSALAGIDVVFHLAAQTSVRVAENDPAQDYEANVRPLVHLLDACAALARAPIVVLAGTATQAGLTRALPANEDGGDAPITAYDRHKLAAERLLLERAAIGAVRGTTLRLTNVYGPGPQAGSADRGVLNAMIGRALRGEDLTLYGAGNEMRDYLFVEDAARAFVAAGASAEAVNARRFVVGSGRGHSLAEAFALVAERAAMRTGRRVNVVKAAPPEPVHPIEARSFVADASRFAQATGWRATVDLTEGIDRTIEACRCAS